MIGLPCWHLDGCTGYCPECFQRPWCEQGCDSCWKEDKEAGCSVFPDSVKRYVSVSPMSLAILLGRQVEYDQRMAEIRERGDGEMKVDRLLDFREEDGILF